MGQALSIKLHYYQGTQVIEAVDDKYPKNDTSKPLLCYFSNPQSAMSSVHALAYTVHLQILL